MFAILHALGMFVADLFKSKSRLEAENLLLRQQLIIALRRAPPRLPLLGSDRALLILMTRLWPSLLGAVQVVQPATILRWHRVGFKIFWRWKSRPRAGRPRIDRGLRDLCPRLCSLLSGYVDRQFAEGSGVPFPTSLTGCLDHWFHHGEPLYKSCDNGISSFTTSPLFSHS
jgi:hypothetical protein